MSDLAEFLDETLRPEDAPSDDVVRGYMAALRSPAESDERAEAEARTPWRVDDEGAADWAARKVKRARELIATKRAERDRIVAAADEWLARETKTLEDDAAFFEGALGDWLRREIEQDPKGKKSRALPCGVTVNRTGGSPSLQVDDEAALVQWLKDYRPDLVGSHIVWEWSKADVKKLRQDDDRLALVDGESGEVVDVVGARIERAAYSYKVDVGGDA